MENYRGDLADIVRASGGGAITGPGESPADNWQFLGDHLPMNYDFGDPFSNIRDPLLLGQAEHISNSSYLMTNSSIKTSGDHHEDISSVSSGNDHNILFNDQKNSISVSVSSNSVSNSSVVVGEELMIKKRSPTTTANCNIFSRMLQISPNTTKGPPCHSIKPPPPPPPSPPLLLSNSSNDIISTTANTSKGCLIENTGGVQISSPRNTGIKRRKSQAKQVVCIPAPAPANSRPTGEVVPSDLWAWRKYGQKPIKGSPYPRGYYRCSSSKGCSARKQVERSRTDPNMLVITYTSEHNHAWPTQRNALAGSTRAQPSKNNNSSNSATAGGSKNINSHDQAQKKDEQYDPSVKQEMLELELHHHDNQILEMDGGDHHHHQHHQFGDQGVSYHDNHQSYRPTLPEDSNLIVHSCVDQDFFADLEEIEADPLNLLFTQGFSGGSGREERENNKVSTLDPFTDLFDWTSNNK